MYQYDNAVGRTSLSQSASTSFALAAGNSNPQGFADPPPAALSDLITPVAKSTTDLELSKVTPWDVYTTQRIADSDLATALFRNVDELMVRFGNARVGTGADACVAPAMPDLTRGTSDIDYTELFDRDLEDNLDLLLQDRSSL